MPSPAVTNIFSFIVLLSETALSRSNLKCVKNGCYPAFA